MPPPYSDNRGKTSAVFFETPLFNTSVDLYHHTYNDPFKFTLLAVLVHCRTGSVSTLPTPFHSAHLSELLKFKSSLFFPIHKRLNNFQWHFVYDLKFHSPPQPWLLHHLVSTGACFPHSVSVPLGLGQSDFTPATSQPWSWQVGLKTLPGLSHSCSFPWKISVLFPHFRDAFPVFVPKIKATFYFVPVSLYLELSHVLIGLFCLAQQQDTAPWNLVCLLSLASK